MNYIKNTISNYMKDDSAHYASNDSGLSWNSGVGSENDIKNLSFQDFQCDDLTKSLFMNSFGGNEIIQDDDIFSYKSRIESNGIFQNKFRSLNFAKFDNFNFKNSDSFSSIIQDLENLKTTSILNRPKLKNDVKTVKDNISNPGIQNSSLRITDEIKCESKLDLPEKVKTKKSMKKNGVQEYMSSSIKDYQGDKDLNDIVSFIQGSPKPPAVNTTSKPKVNKVPSIKVDASPPMTSELAAALDSGVSSHNCSPRSKDTSQSNIDVDSGTQSSPFISLNNSDEDMSQLFVEDFREVLSKKQKKTSSIKSDNPLPSPSRLKPVSNIKSTLSNEKSTNKIKKTSKIQTKSNCCTSSILNTKESFHNFLSDQYILFAKKFNALS